MYRHSECQRRWFIMLKGICSIMPGRSCQLFSELECRPRDPCVSMKSTWHFIVEDTATSLSFVKLKSERQQWQFVSVPRCAGREWRRAGCSWSRVMFGDVLLKQEVGSNKRSSMKWFEVFARNCRKIKEIDKRGWIIFCTCWHLSILYKNGTHSWARFAKTMLLLCSKKKKKLSYFTFPC